jgi:hypothetical protein
MLNHKAPRRCHHIWTGATLLSAAVLALGACGSTAAPDSARAAQPAPTVVPTDLPGESSTTLAATATRSCQADTASVPSQPVADLIAERTYDVVVLARIDISQPAGLKAAIDLSLHLKALDEGIADEASSSADGALHAKALDEAAADDRIVAQLCQPTTPADAFARDAATRAALVMMCQSGLADTAARATYLAAAAAHQVAAQGIGLDCAANGTKP